MVSELHVIYSLDTALGRRAEARAPAGAALDGATLFVQAVDDYNDVVSELSRFFNGGTVRAELSDFLFALFMLLARQVRIAPGALLFLALASDAG